MNSKISEPRVTIKPNAMYFYCLPVDYSRRVQVHTGNLYQYSNNVMQLKQIKRIREIVNVLSIISKYKGVYSREKGLWFKFKLSFITLTLPVDTEMSDKELKSKVFSPLMNRLEKQRKELLYIYKAEVSDNDRLHLHITTNVFIHHKKLRKLYISQLKKAGILKDDDKRDYPCTEIKAVQNVKNIAAYISSYISKKDMYKKPLKRYFKIYGKRIRKSTDTEFKLPKNYFQNLKRKINCRIWDASKCLKIKPPSVNIEEAEVNQLVKKVEKHPEYIYERLDYIGIGKVNNNMKKDIPEYIRYIKNHYKEALKREAENQTVNYMED
jgi:hypothetical protein